MVIVYLGSFRFPKGDAAAARVLNVAKALRMAGHNVSFISWGGEQRLEDICEDGVCRFDGFPYVVTNEIDAKGCLFKKVKERLRRGAKTKTYLKKHIDEYDVILSYNGSIIMWLISFCKKNNKKLVCDLTEWYSYSELKFADRIKYFFEMYCFQLLVKNKIVISSYLNRFYNKTHNIVIPALCDASEPKWDSDNEDVESKTGRYEGITLIYAGNPARKDAVHYVISAVQRLVNEGENLRFLLLGTLREDYLTRYASLLPKGELSDRIQFLGRVPQDSVPAYYRLSDFMVLLREPTKKSNAGFPTKFSESFTSGTPVVANLTSDLGKYLKDGETGFVVSDSSEDAIYKTLKEKVIGLSLEQIVEMKTNVKEIAKQLDYRAYKDVLNDFVENLE